MLRFPGLSRLWSTARSGWFLRVGPSSHSLPRLSPAPRSLVQGATRARLAAGPLGWASLMGVVLASRVGDDLIAHPWKRPSCGRCPRRLGPQRAVCNRPPAAALLRVWQRTVSHPRWVNSPMTFGIVLERSHVRTALGPASSRLARGPR